MRTYGRTTDPITGAKTWVMVTTDENGFNDMVYVTTLAQTLLLNLGESPFFGNYGIPARPSVITQIFPDYYVAYTQQKFATYFANLVITKEASANPVYDVSVTTHQGVKINAQIQVPI